MTDLILKPSYPPYPPYSQGLYLEEYIFEFYQRRKEEFPRTLIPVSWTTNYVENLGLNLQEFVDSLDPAGSYFAVSQHDDGIKEKLPPDTLYFGAGGLGGGIPIPLICKKIPREHYQYTEKTNLLFCSFVASHTHQLRFETYRKFSKRPDWLFQMKNWKNTVSMIDFHEFIRITRNSRFALAIRGYGLTSFRLYEIIQLGAIPVYISDKFWLPWQDELDWSEFCVLVTPEEIPHLPDILENISEKKQKSMIDTGQKIYDEFFSLEGVSRQILKRL